MDWLLAVEEIVPVVVDESGEMAEEGRESLFQRTIGEEDDDVGPECGRRGGRRKRRRAQQEESEQGPRRCTVHDGWAVGGRGRRVAQKVTVVVSAKLRGFWKT